MNKKGLKNKIKIFLHYFKPVVSDLDEYQSIPNNKIKSKLQGT